MAHEVNFSVPERELGKTDITFDVKKDGKKFGTLKASKGAVVWVPRDHEYGLKLDWATVDKLFKGTENWVKETL